VIEKNKLGREASWAAAGMLQPVGHAGKLDPIDELRSFSDDLHASWSEKLKEISGIDNGYWNCGAIYLARTSGECGTLSGNKLQWREEQVEFEELDRQQLEQRVPALGPKLDQVQAAVWLPDESQFCTPRHLDALQVACRKLGVDLYEETDILDFELAGGRVNSISTSAGPFQGKSFCAAAGAWTPFLLKRLDIELSMLPVRGQMLAFKLPEPAFETIINEGPRYLIPRRDGWVLAGSTLEHAGFDKSLSAEGQRALYEFATGLLDDLNEKTLAKRWAGLRPGTFDGFPYIGVCPGMDNLYVATGHFRFGLAASTGTAVLIRELLEARSPSLDLRPFRVSRG